MNKWYSAALLAIILLAMVACSIPDGASTPLHVDGLAEQGLKDDQIVAGDSDIPPFEGAQTDNDTDGGLAETSESPADQNIPPVAAPDSTLPAPSTATSETNAAIEPTIEYFRSNVTEADPGDILTLEWSTSEALTVTLWHLAPTGQLSNWWDVASSGVFDYPVNPRERNSTNFVLYAGDSDHTEMASVSIMIRCPDTWFFDDEPDICPMDAPLTSAGALQGFEGGTMIWVEEENHIYVLFSDENSPGWSRHVDEWDPGEPEDDPTLAAPDGFYQPVRGFGLVWREEPGVRDRLGWAVNDEAGFTTMVQRTSYAKYNETYILAQDGEIWRLLPERSRWEKIAGDS